MLTTRVDKKKVLEYSAVLGIIFLIILYMILTNFVFEPGGGEDIGDSQLKVTPVKAVKEIKVEIIEDVKFKNLQENTYIEKNLDDLKVGKDNPFAFDGKEIKTKE